MKTESNKKNLLLIMCDQLRQDMLGCYGNKIVHTPNIDRIAKKGVCFENAYSETPVCMPARYGLITGKNPCRIGMWQNTDKTPEPKEALPECIRKNGYFTAAVGKMHFYPVRSHYGFDRMYLSEEIPNHIDEDDYLQFLQAKGYGDVIEPHGQRSETYYVPQLSKLPPEMHTDAWTADNSVEFIRKNRNHPFFLFSSFIKPHPPFEPAKEYLDMYKDIDVPQPIKDNREFIDEIIDIQNGYKVDGFDKMTPEKIDDIRRHYYACITQLDFQIGKIIDALEKYDLYDDTMIIFTADHGEMLADHNSFGKRCYFDQAANIPLIISNSDNHRAGEKTQQLVILEDVYETLIETAGAKPSSESDGINLNEICMGTRDYLRDYIVGGFGVGCTRKYLYIDKNYKYIYHVNGGREQLYNRNDDDKELQNIAAENKNITEICKSRIEHYLIKHNVMDDIVSDRLAAKPFEKPAISTFINQYPHWPETVLKD